MASPPLLDFDALLAPISEDNPAGEDLPFEIRRQLDEDRTEVDDPDRPEDIKKADWRGVGKVAEDTLMRVSKHFRPAARLTEALLKMHGYAGLRDGLQLLLRMTEECWDRLNPPLNDADDLELRAADLHWLDSPDRGARFPSSVRLVLLFGPQPEYSVLDLEHARDGKGPKPWDEFQQVVQATDPERCRTAAEDLGASLETLDQLARVLAEKMGPAAPGLNDLRQAVGGCHTILRQVVQTYFAATAPVEAASGDGQAAAAAGGVAPAASAVTSREEAYRRLAEVGALLKQIEPHSPIPYLIERAIELGRLPFPLLIRELVRDANVLSDVNRFVGIKEPTEESG